MASKRAGRGPVLFGLLVLLAGLGGAVALYLLSLQRDDDAIRDLARAPVGCNTIMSFKDTGTFYVYIEHIGTLESLEGDCETPDEYSRDADDEPTVQISVTDRDGDELELDRLDDEFTYSLGDSFAGTAKRRVEVESTGDYVVTVGSDDDDFVVAVGRNPAHAGDTMRLGALASGVAGIVLGLGLVLVGVRRARRSKRVETMYTVRPSGWPVGAPMPTAPPAMQQPPMTQPMPAPQHPGHWPLAPPVGPPIASPAPRPPSGPHPSGDRPTPGPFAPPRAFAPPEMPTLPATPPGRGPIMPQPAITPPDPSAPSDANRGGAPVDDRGDGDVRGDASR